MKRFLTLFLAVMMLAAFTSCKKGGDNGNTDKDQTGINSGEMPEVVTGSITFKDYGTMKFELYPKRAEQSVLNFIHLAKDGFYNGIIVHRLVSDFVIQAGAYETGYVEKTVNPQYTIKGEFSANGVENDIKHVKGTLSWARPKSYDGASTQFFICTSDNINVTSLDGLYAAFGVVTDGLDVIDKINSQPVGPNDVPTEEIMIESVVIDSDYEFPEPDYILK